MNKLDVLERFVSELAILLCKGEGEGLLARFRVRVCGPLCQDGTVGEINIFENDN